MKTLYQNVALRIDNWDKWWTLEIIIDQEYNL